MKKALSILMAGLVVLAAGMPAEALAQHRGHYRGRAPVHQSSHRGYSRSHRGWSTAGSLLAGVVIGGMLQNACAAPPHREVVYTRTVYQTAPVVQYVQPAPVIHYVQPEPVVIRSAPPPTMVTVWIQHANGSQTPVELRSAGDGRFIGPKGEYYSGFPSTEQLCQIYGL